MLAVHWSRIDDVLKQAGDLSGKVIQSVRFPDLHVPQAYPMQQFIDVLKLDATLVNVGALDQLQGVNGGGLIFGRKSIAGSVIGGIAETQEVIDYCAARNIKADIETIRAEDINWAYDRVVSKDVRYRFVIDMASLKGAGTSRS
jgi:uncharacterized zinc-type alcohol dehydrogenase-like protein